MANPKIEVEVGANIKGLQAGAQSAGKIVDQIGDSARKSATSVDALKAKFAETNGTIQLLQARLSSLKSNLESATDIKSIANYNRRIKDTADELNRVKSIGIQDTSVKIDSRDVAKLILQLQKAKSEIDRLKEPVKIDAPIAPKFVEADGIIARLQQRLSNLRKNLEDATDIRSIAKYNIRIQQTRDELARLGDVGVQSSNKLEKVPASINKLTKATSGYNSVGVEFARIIQDAPYGIIGVGNNITQLAQSMQNARNQGQSFASILSGMFASGNLLILGVSALTTAFTLLSQNGFFKSEETAKTLDDRLKSLRETLDTVNRLTIEGAANGEKEARSFELLRAQAENANVPMNKRLESVRDLKKEYPEYLKGLTNEQILTGNVGGAYDNLTKSIVATAKARAFSDQIAKNSLNLFSLEEEQAQRVNKILEIREKIRRAEQNTAAQGLQINGQFTAQNTELVRFQNELNDLISEQVSGREEVNKISSENLDLEAQINNQLSKGASFTESHVSAAKELKNVEDEIAKAVEYRNRIMGESLSKYNDLVKSISNTEFKPVNVDLSGYQTEQAPENAPAALFDFQSQIDGLLEYNDVFSKTIGAVSQFKELQATIAGDGTMEEKLSAIGAQAQMIQVAFDALGGAIKDAFGQSNTFLGTLLSNLVSFAGRIIAQYFAISMAASLAGASQSAAATGPGAIFTLPTFLALGASLVAAAFAGLGGGNKGAAGGVGSGGVAKGSSFVGTTSDSFNPNQTIGLSGEFKISGRDLVYVIDQTKLSEN